MNRKFCKKIFLAILFFILIFETRAFSFDEQWKEEYDDKKDSIRVLALELERLIGKENLFYTPESVRALLESSGDIKFDRQMVRDYLGVLEAGGGYVAGYIFPNISDDVDIKDIKKILSTDPPYNVEFYDEARYKIKTISAYIALVASYFPQYIRYMRDEILTAADIELRDRLLLSAYLLYIKKHITKTDEILPLIAEVEKKFMNANYSYTKADWDKIEDAINKRVEELNLTGNHPQQAENYARQIEASYLYDKAKMMKARYELHNDLMTKDDIWKLKDYLAEIESFIELEEGYGRGLLQAEQVEMQHLVKLLSDFFPRLSFLIDLTHEEVDNRVNWLAMLNKVWTVSKNALFSLLGSEIWSGEGYRITLRKLVTVLIALLASVLICKWLSMLIVGVFFSRLTEDAKTLVRKTLFYSMLFVAVLIAFHFADIPMTSFAFLGGALAIGIGFGTQNIFNNIISGFILATTRPFKAGDQITFGDESYVVVAVGERATHLWTFDDKDVFVQNKMFLEDTVTNLTYLENARLRLAVDVGVEYGTDYRDVKKCLLEIAQQHEKVLKSPEPFVTISDFGESSINFSLYFWIDLKHSSQIKTTSKIREIILDEFAQNGIKIAYPKLDVQIKN